jgi:hypothetical protein
MKNATNYLIKSYKHKIDLCNENIKTLMKESAFCDGKDVEIYHKIKRNKKLVFAYQQTIIDIEAAYDEGVKDSY